MSDRQVDEIVRFDHGRKAWSAVAASWCIHFVVLGIPSSYGVFQEYYVANSNSYHGSHSTFSVAIIGAIVNCSLGLYGIPVGLLTDIFGNHRISAVGAAVVGLSLLVAAFSVAYWQIMLTQGILFGAGCPIAFYPALTIISHHFSIKKGLATGIAVSGSGIGGLVLSPMIQHLLTKYGPRTTLLVLALMAFIIILLSSFFLKPRIAPSGSRFRYLPIRSTICELRFLRLFIVAIFSSMGYFVPFFYVPSFAVYHGMNAFQGSLAVGLMNGASALGRISLGAMSDRMGHINTLLISQMTASLSVLVIWPFSTNMVPLTFFSIIYGFFIGGHISMLPTVIADFFSTNNIATITGMVYTGFFFGNLIGPPVCGYMIDAFKSTDDTSQIGLFGKRFRLKMIEIARSVLKSMISKGGFDALILSKMTIINVTKGEIAFEFRVGSEHLNRGMTTHGGVISTLVDIGGSLAVASMTGSSYTGVSTDLSVSFCSASRKDDVLIVESKCHKAGKNLAFTTTNLKLKERGSLIATGSHTKYIGNSPKSSKL